MTEQEPFHLREVDITSQAIQSGLAKKMLGKYSDSRKKKLPEGACRFALQRTVFTGREVIFLALRRIMHAGAVVPTLYPVDLASRTMSFEGLSAKLSDEEVAIITERMEHMVVAD